MPFDDRSPFTYQEGLAAGLSRHVMESSERYRRVLRNVYVHAEVKTDGYVEARAALKIAQPGAFASHHTAARLWRGVVPHSPVAHVGIPAGRGRSQRRDVMVHSSRRSPTSFRGTPVTTATDTFLDLAAHLDLVDLVVLGDSLVKRQRFTPEQLVTAMDRASGRGVRLARRAASLVRAGVDSPMETRSRMLRVLSGLPELDTDIRIFAPDGQLIRRLDAGDERTRTAVEYDGRQHISREQHWEDDLVRREEFENDEWRIMTLVSKDIYRTPGRSVQRMTRLFRSRGIPLGRPSQEWRRYFVERDSG